ncbi:MAG: GGDEF domain-containing protein [Negativicutes bacterium]|nr:GGDEF domain-containing protein [Negativicutes bacterium]
MLLDTYTMYLMLCLGNFIVFIMLVFFGRSTQPDGLFTRYTYAKLFQCIGLSLVIFKGIVPAAISAIIGNGLLFAGILLEAFCIIYVGKTPSQRAAKDWVRIALLLIAGFVVLYLSDVSTVVRTSVAAIVLASTSLIVSGGLLFFNNATTLRRVSGFLFLGCSIFHIYRAIGALSNPLGYMFFDGQTVAFLMAYVHMMFSTMAFLLMSREVSDIKLKQAATMDYLTGIYNRMQFMNLAKKLVSLLARQKRPVSVLMLDLDHFKAINDKYGHFTGDEVLVHFSKSTTAVLRPEDIFARYGGEEFIILLPNTGSREVMLIGQRIKNHLADAVTNKGVPHYTVSMGAATIIPAHRSELAKVMRMADEALFQAKRGGRNKVIQYGVS